MAKPPGRWFGVGKNTYPGAPLAGCLEDVSTIERDLQNKFNAVGWATLKALNLTAKKKNIIEGLKWLGYGAVSGQPLVYSDSGHGTPQMKNGRLQTVSCPIDFDWSEEHSLFAHEVLEVIGNYPLGVHLLIIWDSCYSEWDADDGMRALGGVLSNPTLITPRLYPLDTQPDIVELHRAAPGPVEDPLADAIKSGAIQCCYIPACLTRGANSAQGETAADVRQGGKAFGAHTHYLSEMWNKLPLTTTLESVVNEQRALLDSLDYQQHSYAAGAQKVMTLKDFFGM